MTPHAHKIITHFAKLDRELVAAGFPATSDWWKKEIRRFYSGGRRRWVVRAGRRGGKSSTFCRLAYVEAKWGAHRIPPGDVGFVMFISKDRDEAAQRLRTIDAIAKAVGDKLEVRGDERLLVGRRTGFKVYSATIAGVSGPTSIMVVGDEVAKWRDADTGANPATDVIASAMPTLATQREARAVWSSSPLGMTDAHARMVDDGQTAHQFVSIGETWVCNPTITEDETHALEPDPRVWAREYAAIPQAGALGCFDPDAIERAIDRDVDIDRCVGGEPVLVLDPSSGAKDAWTWCTAQWIRTPEGSEHIVVHMADGVAGRFFEQVSGDAIVDRLAAFAHSHGIRSAHSDQRESMMLRSAFIRRGMSFHVHDWTSPSKVEAVARVRRWLADGSLLLPAHEKLRLELLNFEERITPSGAFTFGARGSGHDDYVALLLTLAMADVDRHLVHPPLPARGPDAGRARQTTDDYGRIWIQFAGGGCVGGFSEEDAAYARARQEDRAAAH